MSETDAFIFMCFAVVINFFTVYMTFDFMRWLLGPFDRSQSVQIALAAAYEIVLTAASYFIYPFVKIAAMPVFNVLLGAALYQNRKKVKLYYIFAFSCFLGLFDFLLCIVMPILLSMFITFIPFNPWQNGLGILLNQVIIFLLYRMFVTRFHKEKILVNGSIKIFGFIILPVFSVMNIVLMYFLAAYLLPPLITFFLICDIFMVPFLNLYLFYLFNKVVQNNEMKKQLALYDQASGLQYRYYQEMEQKLADSRKTVHDMKNHLQAMERLYQTGEAEKGRQYGDDLRQLLNSFSQDYYTDNRVLNIVINDKAERGKMSGVPVSCALNQIDLSFMKEMDITTIFANLLDNAIEAACEAREPWTKLKADNVRDFIVISVENSMKNSPALNESRLNSSKEGHQGYGLENVKRALERYNGHLRIETGGNTFKVSLFIPVQTEVKDDA